MVKQFDDILPDHIGWRLHEVNALWLARFRAGMVDAGYPWFAEARASVLGYVGEAGAKQADIVRKMGLTKQAVQQMVQDLEVDGIVTREPDPDDRRGKIVCLTDKGMAAKRGSVAVKKALDAELRAHLGDAAFEALRGALTDAVSWGSEAS